MKIETRITSSILDNVWSKIINAIGTRAIKNINKLSFLMNEFLIFMPFPNNAAIPM